MKSCSALLFLFAISCQKASDAANNNNIVTAEKIYMNVSYGNDAKQKMDIYLPAARTTAGTKSIILCHGGGWSTGDKTDFTPFVDSLKRRLTGYAIFNINYRLANRSGNTFPTQENDIKSALEFIYTKRNDYYISDKFVLLGASAGAHLALLHAYKYVTPVKIKAVVDFFGPVDLVEMYNNPASALAPPVLLANVIGATPDANPLLYEQSSPLHFVSPQSPPTIILQGGVDPLVSPSQSQALKTKLGTMGVVNQYILYPAETHGWFGTSLTHSFTAIQAFLAANVN